MNNNTGSSLSYFCLYHTDQTHIIYITIHNINTYSTTYMKNSSSLTYSKTTLKGEKRKKNPSHLHEKHVSTKHMRSTSTESNFLQNMKQLASRIIAGVSKKRRSENRHTLSHY